jgi:thioredoxin 1
MKTLAIIAAVAAMNYGLYTWNKTGGAVRPATIATMNEGKVVVYFGATWCGPCRQTKPRVQELAQELSGKVSFLFIDVDEQSALSQKYEIRSIPALVVLDNGKDKAHLHGGPKEVMKQEILELL